MARPRSGYRCSECGWQTAAYVGRCGECQGWNTLEQVFAAARNGPASRATRISAAAPAKTLLLADVPDSDGARLITGIAELDSVLGGGLVPGSLVLAGGEPGIGKSTLVLQACAQLAAAGQRVAYVCGEESPRQVRMRATRLGLDQAPIILIPETNLESALAAAEAGGATVVAIDSIQSVYVEGLDSRVGGPAQLAEAGTRLVTWAKGNSIATILTGHVTKGGEIAGPRLLEHLVDVVLYFENAESGALRILRAVKNRFGATDEVGVFEMTGEGLRSVENPSAAFLDAVDRTASGCAATATIEGSRPLVVEIQALAVPSFLATPRRIASGIETSRLHLLLAVLARRGGLNAGNLDVVATVSGGLRLRDPATDLAVAMALASAVKDRALDPATGFVGEVALSGAIRPVGQPARRLAELARLGFQRALVPTGTPAVPGITNIEAATLRDALAHALPGSRSNESAAQTD
ncbi:MAG: DNA repair protein RadA [Dehalococcoidia bacterium]